MKGLLLLFMLAAQAPAPGAAQQPAKSPKEAAPVDLTGNWVSIVAEDWRWRMVTPLKGDAASVPINAEGRKLVDAWDPARDEAAGLQCKSYGAPAIMRVPGRLRISWQDDTTMKMELEAGSQTRVFHFGAAPSPTEPSFQGRSVAEWQYTVNPPRSGELRVLTSRLRPGYLRKNGVPYSANTTMTEYYHRMTAPNGDLWITVVTEITDPENLREPFVQSTHFKKLPASATFKPEPCDAR